jgi:hypothetical protein
LWEKNNNDPENLAEKRRIVENLTLATNNRTILGQNVGAN